jgi:hypothetical protein
MKLGIYVFINKPRIFSVSLNHNPVLSSFMSYHRVCNKSNTTCGTCGKGTAYGLECLKWNEKLGTYSVLLKTFGKPVPLPLAVVFFLYPPKLVELSFFPPPMVVAKIKLTSVPLGLFRSETSDYSNSIDHIMVRKAHRGLWMALPF